MNHNEAMELMECALEALVSRCNASADACTWEEVIAAEAALERIYKSRKAIEQAEKQEPVSELTDDEIYDAAHATFCRGPNTRELFRMMWTSNPPCSIGWDRDELKAFARHIASFYTSPPQLQPLSDKQISNLWDGHTVPVFGKTGINPIVFARAIEAAHGIKGEP